MAGKRTEPAADAPTPEDAPKPTQAVLVEPPTTTRTRQSTAAPELISSMAEQVVAGWATDGVQYATRRDASNASVVLRRAVIRAMGGNPNAKGDATAKRIKTKVWEAREGGTATGKPLGKYVFALHAEAAAS